MPQRMGEKQFPSIFFLQEFPLCIYPKIAAAWMQNFFLPQQPKEDILVYIIMERYKKILEILKQDSRWTKLPPVDGADEPFGFTSSQECEVKEMILDGMSAKEIAEFILENWTQEKKFPSGFDSWRTTFFFISGLIFLFDMQDADSSVMKKVRDEGGRYALIDLAEQLADEFEAMHVGRQWDGEYEDELQIFANKKLS